MPISELLFGTLTQNQSSLEPSLGFTAIAGTLRAFGENSGTFAVDFADGRRDRHNFYVRPDAPQLAVSWHSDPERGFQADWAALRVLRGWRRSELPASQVLYEGVTQDPVPTFDGSQLLRNSSYVSKKSDTGHRSASPRQGLYVSCTIHNARRAGNRGKSKRRLKTTLVCGAQPEWQ